MNRLGQVPAKGLPDFAVHQGSRQSTHADSLWEPVSRIDCGFRNLSSLGLLSGFQRPSRLHPAVLLCYRSAQPHRFQPAGRLLYSEPFSLSSGRCRFAFSVHREGELLFSFVGGAEPTAVPPFVSTRFIHHRVSSQPRCVDFLFRSVLLRSARSSHRQCGFAFPSEGARLLSPRPKGVNHLRRLPHPRSPLLSPARHLRMGEAASTTAAS